MLENIVTIFFSVIETIVVFLICGAFFDDKNKSAKIITISLSLATMIFVRFWNLTLIKNNIIPRIIIAFLIYLCMTNFLFYGKLTAKITFISLTFVLIYTIDVIAIGLCMLLFKISYTNIMQFGEINIIISMMSKSVLLGLAIIINKLKRIYI